MDVQIQVWRGFVNTGSSEFLDVLIFLSLHLFILSFVSVESISDRSKRIPEEDLMEALRSMDTRGFFHDPTSEYTFHGASDVPSFGSLESTWAWQLDRTYNYGSSPGVSLFHSLTPLEDLSPVDMAETDAFDDPVLQFMQDILMEEDENEHDWICPVNDGAYRAIAKEVAGLLQEDSPSLHLGNMPDEQEGKPVSSPSGDSGEDFGERVLGAQGTLGQELHSGDLVEDAFFGAIEGHNKVLLGKDFDRYNTACCWTGAVPSIETSPEGIELPFASISQHSRTWDRHGFFSGNACQQEMNHLPLQAFDAIEKNMGGSMRANTHAVNIVNEGVQRFGGGYSNEINPQHYPLQGRVMVPASKDKQHEPRQRVSQQPVKLEADSRPQLLSQTFRENGAGTEIEFLQGGNECVPPQEKTAENVAKRRKKRTRGKRQQLVDLKELLVQCAQFLGSNDYAKASDILKQLEEHVSQYGDGTQRVAYYFLEALRARMSGSGGIVASRMRNNRPPASVMIKANKAFVAACPYAKLTHFFANQTILDAFEGASRLHVVDFGILYGFQWPSLMCALGARPNGPPFLRITGIDNPCPGPNPTEKLQDTGRRLEEFAKKCRVPFDYKPVACRWETLDLDTLNLKEGEVVIVNCINRLRHVMDETAGSSARQVVLEKMRKINPKVFVFGAVSAGYNSPFFITRFKEAIHHFSAVFDSLENTMEREDPDRFIIESETLAHVIQGAVACEGAERIERPEKFKQWQKRCRDAGFRQLPLNANIKTKACKMLRAYHKEFEIGVDGEWMLLGWKGSIVNALSTWCPH